MSAWLTACWRWRASWEKVSSDCMSPAVRCRSTAVADVDGREHDSEVLRRSVGLVAGAAVHRGHGLAVDFLADRRSRM